MKGGRLIKYNAFEPETLEFWVPPAFYRDGKIELKLEKIRGDYAVCGPIYVYKFGKRDEGEFLSGIQTIKTDYPDSPYLPTFVKNENIEFNVLPFKNPEIEVFDVSGRKIMKSLSGNNKILPFNFGAGIYFIILKNPETGKKIKSKVIKLK